MPVRAHRCSPLVIFGGFSGGPIAFRTPKQGITSPPMGVARGKAAARTTT
jgi:hypothetical protein